MMMYNSSGTAQLDLSRPGYKDVRNQIVNNDNEFGSYSGVGIIDSNSIKEFKKLYKQQAQKINLVDAFAGDPLNPEVMLVSANVEQ